MPKRTNLFQEVVEIIHSHMAEGATVEPSAMLRNKLTGYDREVDVVIRSQSAGYELIVSVEATGRSEDATGPPRPANVEWVERLLAKHKNLPTHQLVLVSETGFTNQARELAEAEGAVPIAPEDLTGGDPAGRVVAVVRSLWPKVVTFTPEELGVAFDDDDVPKDGWSKYPGVYADDSSRLADTLPEFVQALYRARFLELMEQIKLAEATEDSEQDWLFVALIESLPVDGVQRKVCLANEDGLLYSVKRITAKGKAVIQVSEIPLKHGRLGEIEVLYAYGEGKIAGRDALVVASTPEGEESGKITFRIRPEK